MEASVRVSDMSVERSSLPVSDKPRGRGQRGFTLVELLVVMVILGLMALFVAPQAIKFLGGAKTDSAEIQVTQLATVLDLYRLEVGRYPSDGEGLEALIERPTDAANWNGPYVRKAESLIDPWGRAYIYRRPGRRSEYDLYSLGADGQEGGSGEDRDVTSW